MPNSPQFVMAYYGILKAGGVVVATNPLYTPPEIEHQASDAGIEVMFVMTNFYKTIKKAQPNTKIKKLIVTNLKRSPAARAARVVHFTARERKADLASKADLPAAMCGCRMCSAK
jgi:acyl-CoA synthetase (AMP-forming)/AMP-acid ligase II